VISIHVYPTLCPLKYPKNTSKLTKLFLFAYVACAVPVAQIPLTTVECVISVLLFFVDIVRFSHNEAIGACQRVSCETKSGGLSLGPANKFQTTPALCPGLPGLAGTRKLEPIWILLKQLTVSGGGISWAICKSAPRSRQITTSAPHHSVF